MMVECIQGRCEGASTLALHAQDPLPCLRVGQPPLVPTPHLLTHPLAGSSASRPVRAPAVFGLWGFLAGLGHSRRRTWSCRWWFPALLERCVHPAWSGRGLLAGAAETARTASAAEAAGRARGNTRGLRAACCTGPGRWADDDSGVPTVDLGDSAV